MTMMIITNLVPVVYRWFECNARYVYAELRVSSFFLSLASPCSYLIYVRSIMLPMKLSFLFMYVYQHSVVVGSQFAFCSLPVCHVL